MAAAWRVLRGPWQGAARTWAWLALIFGVVSIWLHWRG
jgi:hypothetical protein